MYVFWKVDQFSAVERIYKGEMELLWHYEKEIQKKSIWQGKEM